MNMALMEENVPRAQTHQLCRRLPQSAPKHVNIVDTTGSVAPKTLCVAPHASVRPAQHDMVEVIPGPQRSNKGTGPGTARMLDDKAANHAGLLATPHCLMQSPGSFSSRLPEWAYFGQSWSNSNHVWPLLGQGWPIVLNLRSILAECGPQLVEIQPMLDDAGPNLAEFGSMIGRRLVDVGPFWSMSGSFRKTQGQIYPNLAELGPSFGWCSNGSGLKRTAKVKRTSGQIRPDPGHLGRSLRIWHCHRSGTLSDQRSV